MGVFNGTAAGGAWIVDWGPVCGAIMGVLSAPQRVEVLSGGAVRGIIMGARGCAAGELDLGPGGGFRAGRGPAGRGWEVVLGGGALGAKSRAPRGWCGGPSEVRPLRPTPWSSRRTLGAPERVQGPGRGVGAAVGGESQPVRFPPDAVGAQGFGAPQELTKGQRKRLSPRALGGVGGAECGPLPWALIGLQGGGHVPPVPLSPSGCPPSLGHLRPALPLPGRVDAEAGSFCKRPGAGGDSQTLNPCLAPSG